MLGKFNTEVARAASFLFVSDCRDCRIVTSCWKHTGNSLAADSDINMLALRDQNGHTSVQTTEIYLKHKLGVVNKEIQNKFPCLDTL